MRGKYTSAPFPLDRLILNSDGSWGPADYKLQLPKGFSIGDVISDSDAEAWWESANQTGCKHEWVDVGFQFSKLVCRKCNIEKPKDVT